MSSLLRRLAERLSRDRILARRLPDRFESQRIWVSPDCALAYWRHDLEPIGRDLFSVIEQHVKPGSVVWDVGANVGLFGLAAALRAGSTGEVLTLEPDLFCADLIRRSASELPLNASRVDVLPLAASDRAGWLDFHVAARGRSTNHLDLSPGSSQTGGARRTLSVPTVTLDHLLVERRAPDVLKIDVEGAEETVLAGASELLQSARPILICEVAALSRAPLGALFAELDYELFDLETGRPSPSAAFNTLAIPRGAAGAPHAGVA